MLTPVTFVWVKLKKNSVFPVKHTIYSHISMVKYLILYDYRNEEVQRRFIKINDRIPFCIKISGIINNITWKSTEKPKKIK